MKKIIFLLLISLSNNAFSELPCHQFKYKNKVELGEYYYDEGLTIENCDNCESTPITDYLVKGIKELASFKGKDRGIKQQWKVGKKSIVVDYHHNYLHLLTLKSKDESNISIKIEKTYQVSGGHGGVGNNPNTQATPPGIHTIWRKQDGTEAGRSKPWPEDYIIDAYKANRKTGVLEPSQEQERFPFYKDSKGKYRSWQFVTTRILRLRGLEKRNNNSEKGKKPKRRSILIHGTNEEGLIGIQASSGCIRMRGHDVIDLFNQVEENTLVNITFVKKPWASASGKKRIGKPNLPYWNYGKEIKKISLEEADDRWLR